MFRRSHNVFCVPTSGVSNFLLRHVGPQRADLPKMLKVVGAESLDAFIASVIPPKVLMAQNPAKFPANDEAAALQALETTMDKNAVVRSCIGMGYHDTHLPSVIQRNLLESPGWYTPYTPYQAEISQGRLESLLNFQTMIIELTKMPVCNASLLDEATAAAEAAFMCANLNDRDKARRTILVSDACHPRTIQMIQTRCETRNMTVKVVSYDQLNGELSKEVCGVVLQYPDTHGAVREDIAETVKAIRKAGALSVLAVDLLAMTMITPPGELDVDICVGTAQRFGVPLGYGGPHAAFLATQEQHKRLVPGRIIGVSKDTKGRRAIRMALQTREQHIRRERATSNICTAQALLANISAMYGVYHGPDGLKAIAERCHNLAAGFQGEAVARGVAVDTFVFDTVPLAFPAGKAAAFVEAALKAGINVRVIDDSRVNVAFDETCTAETVATLTACLTEAVGAAKGKPSAGLLAQTLRRTSDFMTQKVFHDYRSETSMMRYMYSLQRKDLGLNVAMVPLGSCTMKLNAASEMLPITWKKINGLHPFCPENQAAGYHAMFKTMKSRLAELMGFDDVLLQPNSGAQGEYAGLRTIRAYHKANGQEQRNKCFVLASAHGTNPASASMAGLDTVVVKCCASGQTDMADLKRLLAIHKDTIACIMITYPSTYGIFETEIKTICDLVHEVGGQVYIDGANLNAMLGLSSPGAIGGDVAHTNLHKTFSIPHGGGGPGQGPIGIKKHLLPFVPGGEKEFGIVSQAPFGSSSILNISYMYIDMMGAEGLKFASKMAILNANYLRTLLAPHYKILYGAANGTCGHEFILDVRGFKNIGVEAEDIAKRLMDYNFHAPTLSFPVAGTLMIEPTESEPLSELDRFANALIQIRGEIKDIEDGKMPKGDNLLTNAPHTQDVLAEEKWEKAYTRESAAFPTPEVKADKFWPTVSRIDGAWGDRNFHCMCDA
eukprot:PhM_4_TR15667/c0_g1_i1/m.84479/K00281/GLDC, gcvP; glycine dehydrogenase